MYMYVCIYIYFLYSYDEFYTSNYRQSKSGIGDLAQALDVELLRGEAASQSRQDVIFQKTKRFIR